MFHQTIFLSVALLASISQGLPSLSRKIQARQGWVPSPPVIISDVTPHDRYASSIGVLGCKINTNRVAYWMEAIDCNNICLKLTHMASKRSVHLLKIDKSGAAHDISYDAWNYLKTGNPAKEGTAATGGPGDLGEVQYEYVDPDSPECKSLIYDPEGKLPLMGANSMNFFSSCPEGSWVKNNTQFWNLNDDRCSTGWNEKCTLLPGDNQPTCQPGHLLGYGGSEHPVLGPADLKGDHKVVNIDYMTGKESAA